VRFKISMMSCKRHIKILKYNLMLFGQAPLKHQVILKLPKPLQAKVVKDVIILILMIFCDKSHSSKVEQVLVESCDEAIGKENDHLKREVKRIDFDVNKLKKQTKVQPPQDNRSNMVKKVEKGRTAPKIASQQKRKQVHHKEEMNLMDEKVEYIRSAYFNARRPHIKSGIGYKTDDKHNSRVKTRGQEFIKFTKATIKHQKNQNIKTTNNASYAYSNASHVSHMSYHDFDDSYVLMRNKIEKIIALHVGPNHKRSKTCVLVSKCLVTNLKGPNQTWVPKNKA
jgi:hypothetical protein